MFAERRVILAAMSRNVFILSSGRTGTKFLAEFFDANYPEVAARHEPAPSYHLRMLSNARAAGAASRGLLAAALRLSRPSLRRGGGGLVIESNPFLYGFVDVLGEVADSPTIIHIVRDPRTYVSSAINHGGSSGLKAAASALIPFWFPPVRLAPGVGQHPGPVELFAGEWALVNRFLVEHGGGLPGYHRLRFEDLFDATHSGLRGLVELLGLPYAGDAAAVSPQEKVNAGRLKVIGGWASWDEGQRGAVERVCGEMMREWGYGDDNGF
jgi:hypothetical protein